MRVLFTPFHKVERVAFSPDGTHLFASGLQDGNSYFDAPDSGVAAFDLGRGEEPTATLFSGRVVYWFAPLPGDRLAAAHTLDGGLNGPNETGVTILDPYALQDASLALGEWSVRPQCAASRDGSRLVAGLFGHKLRGTGFERGIGCWELSGKRPPHFRWVINLKRNDLLYAVAFAPDGRSFWTAEWVKRTAWKMELVPRDTDTGQPLCEPVGYPNKHVADLALGGTFAVAHDGPALFIYDLGHLDRKPKKLTNPAKRKHFGGFAIHPSGKWLAAAGLDGAVTLWEAATWTVAQNWAWKAGAACCVCFSADGTLAAVGTDTGRVVVWDLDL